LHLVQRSSDVSTRVAATFVEEQYRSGREHGSASALLGKSVIVTVSVVGFLALSWAMMRLQP
jgi:hypothetical protein